MAPPTTSSPVSVRVRIGETLERANLTLLASALAFDGLLTAIPLAFLIIVGLGHLLESTTFFGTTDPAAFVIHFLPEHAHGGSNDPFALIEALILKIRGFRTELTWVLVPAFVWLSTRLFAAIRVSLSQIFQVRQRPSHRHFVLRYVLGYLFDKLRDIGMVAIVLALTACNVMLVGALRAISAQGVTLQPPWTFLASTIAYVLGHAIAVGCGLALFTLLYRYASPKRLRWSAALVAGALATLGFEIAKWLYGFYLVYMGHGKQYSIDASVGAVWLLVLWIWYMALVFLVGAAVADVWDHARRMREVPIAAAAPEFDPPHAS
ncbi:MAG TPA: YihY/virulence factor BrkB family protein [Gemmatimonadales bacterium]|jgi:uncharacterized BrkB/YihY/UPF0761 family membrane protein|nr:YihY/virulence factor BrkB family protein [Gemmatimonadales bacterium]